MKKKNRCIQNHVKKIPALLSGGLHLRDFSIKNGFQNVSIVHVTMPPQYRHELLFHAKTHEWFYVLEGKTTVLIDNKPRKLRPGSFIYIAPKVSHIVSSGKQEVKVLVLFSPPMNTKSPDIHMVKNRK